jgi:DNA polymerase-3 subunit delta'
MDFETWLVKLQSPNTMPQLFVDEGNALLRRLSYTAHASRYKIVLMWQPERMREDTANKMLKLVEEPYPDTLFIMTSDNSRQILPTIYSRVQRIAVKRYDNQEVANWLMTQGVSDAQAAADAAMLAEGNLNKALRLLGTQNESSQHLEWFMQLMRLAYQRKIADLKQWSQTVGAEKREMLIRFLDYCCRMLRENFISNFHNPQFNLMTTAESKFSVNFARFINERNVLPLFDAFSQAATDVAGNANGKIVMFDLAITVILLLKN